MNVSFIVIAWFLSTVTILASVGFVINIFCRYVIGYKKKFFFHSIGSGINVSKTYHIVNYPKIRFKFYIDLVFFYSDCYAMSWMSFYLKLIYTDLPYNCHWSDLDKCHFSCPSAVDTTTQIEKKNRKMNPESTMKVLMLLAQRRTVFSRKIFNNIYKRTKKSAPNVSLDIHRGDKTNKQKVISRLNVSHKCFTSYKMLCINVLHLTIVSFHPLNDFSMSLFFHFIEDKNKNTYIYIYT